VSIPAACLGKCVVCRDPARGRLWRTIAAGILGRAVTAESCPLGVTPQTAPAAQRGTTATPAETPHLAERVRLCAACNEASACYIAHQGRCARRRILRDPKTACPATPPRWGRHDA